MDSRPLHCQGWALAVKHCGPLHEIVTKKRGMLNDSPKARRGNCSIFFARRSVAVSSRDYSAGPPVWNRRPVVVLRNGANGIASCLRKPFDGRAPSRTISITDTEDAEVVQAIAVRRAPPATMGS